MTAALACVLAAAAGALSSWLYFRRRLRAASRRTVSASAPAPAAPAGPVLATIASMAEGVVVVDAAGRSVLTNRALLTALGISKEPAPGAYYWEIFRDSEVNEMIGACLKERTVVKKEHSVLLSEKTFEIQVSPVEAAGFSGAVGVFHDVTRLKELERTRTEFVANVSHELKTPLTSILGYVETLKEGAVDDVKNRMSFLSTIEEHAQNLTKLVEDLLLLSSVESGKGALRIGETDLSRAVDRAFAEAGRAAREKNVSLKKDLDPPSFAVHVDEALFARVLANLVDNAVKYNVSGGSVTLRASKEGRGARIEVIDTGMGISETDLPRVFERFYRADKSRSREGGGTGIGLSIAKHIVERHGGRIEAESVLQKGSKFTVILP